MDFFCGFELGLSVCVSGADGVFVCGLASVWALLSALSMLL